MKNNKPENYDDIAQYNVWTVEIPTPVKRKEKLPETLNFSLRLLTERQKHLLLLTLQLKINGLRNGLRKKKHL